MKKVLAFMASVLILTLTACGAGVEDVQTGELAELVQDAEGSKETVVVEETAPDGSKTTRCRQGSTSGTELWSVTEYPDGSCWEVYYDESGLMVSEKRTYADGSSEEYRYENGSTAFSSYKYSDGSCDESYYENGLRVRSVWNGADGTISESTYDGDGNVALIKTATGDGSSIEERYENGEAVSLTVKEADGSYSESQFENGIRVFSVSKSSDGTSTESTYDEKGELTAVKQSSADGSYSEERYENGITVGRISYNATTKQYDEELYYQNGAFKYKKYQTVDSTLEVRYDEDGYTTYYYGTDEETTVECIADETGKLVKYIENGEAYTDAKTLARVTATHGFRK